MKKVLLLAVLILGGIYYSAISTFAEIGFFTADGYVLDSNDVLINLTTGGEEEVEAVRVNSMDTIYNRLNSYYTGEDARIKINDEFPIFLDGGVAVEFMNENFILFDNAFARYESYNHLILNDGSAFNFDGSRATFDDYLFVKLPNSLYLNTGAMRISTTLHDYVVPTNALMNLMPNQLSYYTMKDGVFSSEIISDIDGKSIVRINGISMFYDNMLLRLGVTGDFESLYGKRNFYEEEATEDIDEEINEEKKDKTAVSEKNGQAAAQEGMAQSGSKPEKDDRGKDKKDKAQGSDPASGSGSDANDSQGDLGDDSGEESDAEGVADDSGDSGESSGESSSGHHGSGSGSRSGGNTKTPEKAQAAEEAQLPSTDPAAVEPAPPQKGKKTPSVPSVDFGKVPKANWQKPEVTPSGKYNAGVYTYKTEVSILDPAGVLKGGGVTYSIYVQDSKGSYQKFKDYSVAGDNSEEQIVIISNLQPKHKYMMTGHYI